MFKCFVILALVAFPITITRATRINPSLERILATKGTANIIIRMATGTKQLLNQLNRIQFNDRASRLNAVTSSLKSHAAEFQKDVVKVLTAEGLQFHSLWISNKVFVPYADAEIVQKLAALEGIAEIHEEYMTNLLDEGDTNAEEVVEGDRDGILAESNIEGIQAHFVWSELKNNGTGAIVAHIDTGVRYTHEALRDNYLGEYGWYDPANETEFPEDRNGQGTHAMGIMVGSAGVGVAPGAKWMSCRGCLSASCFQSDLERCAQFVICPTLSDGSAPQCTNAPHVVANAWTSNAGDSWFDSALQAWKTAGIVPVFANGNRGPNCGTILYPPDSSEGVVAVGGNNNDEVIYYSSSQGPTIGGLIKPDISAPAYSIRSASRSSDTSYTYYTGTKQAASHVGGVIALMVAEERNLSYVDVQKFLFDFTDRNIQHTGRNCGGISETTFPNNAFGWGRLNAFKSVRAVRNSMKI